MSQNRAAESTWDPTLLVVHDCSALYCWTRWSLILGDVSHWRAPPLISHQSSPHLLPWLQGWRRLQWAAKTRHGDHGWQKNICNNNGLFSKWNSAWYNFLLEQQRWYLCKVFYIECASNIIGHTMRWLTNSNMCGSCQQGKSSQAQNLLMYDYKTKKCSSDCSCSFFQAELAHGTNCNLLKLL